MGKLMIEDIRELMEEAEASFPHEACRTCECFLGYTAKLRVDGGKEARAELAAYKVDRNEMHGCLGCDPCPPGDLYAAYVKGNGRRLVDQ